MTFPNVVKALTFRQTGDVDVIEQTNIPFPSCTPGDLLIKVHTKTNDGCYQQHMSGHYPMPPEAYPVVFGTEMAGSIVALPTNNEILNNADYKKRGFKLGGKVVSTHPRAFAEYLSIPWQSALPVPDAVPSANAAAAFAQGLTTITLMTEAHNVQAGETVLIHTVAGGLGLMMAQYAKLRGATVIGTTSTPEKAAFAKQHGADHVILYKQEDTAASVLKLTGGAGVEAVFDGVGKDTFDTSLKVLKRKGTFVSVGIASGPVPAMDAMRFNEKNNKFVCPNVAHYTSEPEEARAYSQKLFELIGEGKLKVNVYQHYPFSANGLQQAHRDLVSGRSTGKLVVDVAGS